MKDISKKSKNIPLCSDNSVITIEALPINTNNFSSRKFNISKFFNEIFQDSSKSKINLTLPESNEKDSKKMIDNSLNVTSYEPINSGNLLTSPVNSKNMNKKIYSSTSSLNGDINSTHSGTSGQKSVAKSSYSTGERNKPKIGYKSLKLSPKEIKHPLRIKKNFSYFRLDNLLNLRLQNADNFNLENISLNGVTIGQLLPSTSKKSDYSSSLTEKGETDLLDKPTNSKIFNDKSIHNSSAIYDSNMSIFPWTLSKLKSMKEMGKNSDSNWSSLVFDAYDEPQSSTSTKQLLLECPLCLAKYAPDKLIELYNCGHKFCQFCLKEYFKIEITEGRISLGCPQCSEPVHPSDVYSILINDNSLINKYEAFTLRRFLVLEPDARWCPAPDCGYAVIASGCASCPMLKCERPGCNTYFCYHCKNEWHPNLTCDAAKSIRFRLSLPHPSSSQLISNWETLAFNSLNTETNIKICPRCQAYIMKMDDGSCNHMTCAICGAEFCWLCMKEISDLHYLSPSGCTFWGKKPWSKKKKILWQLGTLVGAPMGIALIASIAIPAIIIGVPIFVGRKIYTKYKKCKSLKRNTAMICGILASIVLSPVLACLAVSIGVPILLAYVYGVVPFSLCQNGIYGAAGNNSRSAPRSTTTETSQTPASEGEGVVAPPTSQTIVLPVGVGGDKGCGGSQSSRPSPTVIITLNQSANVGKPKRRTMASWVDRLVSFASQSTTTRSHVITTSPNSAKNNSSRKAPNPPPKRFYFSLCNKNNEDAFIPSPDLQPATADSEKSGHSSDMKACSSANNYRNSADNCCETHSYSDHNPSSLPGVRMSASNDLNPGIEPRLISDFSPSKNDHPQQPRSSLSVATSGLNLDRSVSIGTPNAPLPLDAHNSSVPATSQSHCMTTVSTTCASLNNSQPDAQNAENAWILLSDSTSKFGKEQAQGRDGSPQPAFKIELVRAEISHHDEDQLKEDLDLEGLKEEAAVTGASKASVSGSGRARCHLTRAGHKSSRGSWSGGSEASACSDKSSSVVLSLLTTDDGASSLRAMAGSIALNREMDEASITALAGSIIGVQMSEILQDPKMIYNTTADPTGTMPCTNASHYSTADVSSDSCSFLSYQSHQAHKTINPDTLSRLSVPPGGGDGDVPALHDSLGPINNKDRTLTPQNNEQNIRDFKTIDAAKMSEK